MKSTINKLTNHNDYFNLDLNKLFINDEQKAQITTTLNFYVHPIISHNKKAGYALEDLLLPQKLV